MEINVISERNNIFVYTIYWYLVGCIVFRKNFRIF